MKLIYLLFIISLNFSLNNASKSLIPKKNSEADNIIGRKLYESDNKTLLLVGVWNFTKEYPNDKKSYFEIYFLSYGNISTRYEYLNLTISVYYNNKSPNQMEIKCDKFEFEEHILHFYCVREINYTDFNRIELNDEMFKFYSIEGAPNENITVFKRNIDESSLFESIKSNISNQTEDIKFQTFNLKNISITDDDLVILDGWTSSKEMLTNDTKINFTFSNNVFTCNYTDYGDTDKITFYPHKSINDHLHGKIGKELIDGNVTHILIYAKDTDRDSLVYSTYENAVTELFGFGDYVAPINGNDAKNRAYFRGTIDTLKKYIRFNTQVFYGSTLRSLQASIKINASGIRDTDNIDFETGKVPYNITYLGTSNLTNIIGMEFPSSFEFSNDNINFVSITPDFIGEDSSLTNKNSPNTENFRFISNKPNIAGNSLSFDLEPFTSNSSQNVSISGKQALYLNYTSLEDSERDEIECTIENKTSYFTVLCEPKKDIYTQLKTLIIKIPKISSGRLRILQSAENSTFYAPPNTEGDIQFEYNPEINTFARKASKKKGLSGGAIAAIVLATVAAIAAVGIAMFFLNRGPINPIKTSTEMNLPNSSTNINN